VGAPVRPNMPKSASGVSVRLLENGTIPYQRALNKYSQKYLQVIVLTLCNSLLYLYRVPSC